MTARGALDGYVALVTGAAQGIGKEIAAQLGQLGASVAVCDVLSPAEVAERPAPPAAYFQCDVTDCAAVGRLVKEVIDEFGTIDILVNNAGIAIDGLLMRTRPEQWGQVIDVNLSGVFNCCKAAARHLLKARRRGRIINISSVVGEEGNPGQVSYAASKAGVIGLTKTLARELAPRGVTVNAVSPGFIETRMTREHVAGDRREQLLARIPLGRIGTPGDVAAAVCFLSSPAAGYITGQVIRVNGGMYT